MTFERNRVFITPTLTDSHAPVIKNNCLLLILIANNRTLHYGKIYNQYQ